CGTTWFQHHPDHAPPEPPEPDAVPEPSPAPDPERAPEQEPAPAAQRRLDPSVADILREEADRERAARAAEADGRIETQPDLGLTEPEPDEARRARQARDRMQRLRGDPPPNAAGTPPRDDAGTDANDDGKDEQDGIDPGSRRNLFPDIEEINSSLSASHDTTGSLAPAMSEDVPPAPRSGGFRTGFRLAVVICVGALVVYLMAPQIIGLWPDAEAPLEQYVQAVDDGRAMLTATVADLLARF
ncbi:MAG: hypothetical protein U5K36_01955, partial [Roseovarius sp.]|nr:hypothetical protein [Roseovarius sp.]